MIGKVTLKLVRKDTPMTLKQLSYFYKIAETKNLTKAAELLNTTQPPLSYQLKTLEDELGVTLFVRDSRNLKITPEGKILRDRVAQILALIDKTYSDINEYIANDIVHIRIGAVSSSNHNLLPHIIKRYKEEYPNVVFDIYDGSSMRIQELIDTSVIDFGIIREPFNKEIYPNRMIKIPGVIPPEGDYFVAVGCSDFFDNKYKNTITFNELSSLPLILHRRFEQLILDSFSKNNLKPTIVSRNDNIVTSIDFLKEGLGIGIMPYSSAILINNLEGILIKKIVDPVIFSNLYIIHSKSFESNEYLDAFLKLL